MKCIDLNSDLGESDERAQRETDKRLMSVVSSINVACGVHAGSPDLMRWTVRWAKEGRVAIGAHPGFRDHEGMGRRPARVTPPQVETLVAYQVGALAAIASLEGATLHHVKPHGALYNMAARDAQLAEAIARGVRAVDPHLILIGLAGSPFLETVRDLGHPAAAEAFVDRGYNPDGTLVPRGYPGDLILEEAEVVTRALDLARDHVLTDSAGRRLALVADTICVHGDTPGAEKLARAVRRALEGAGIAVTPLPRPHA